MSRARPSLRKSPFGCETCKTRKVKCDEVRPVCGNCARRFIGLERCEYRRSRQSEMSSIPSAMAIHPFEAAGNPSLRSFEMRLMHHYTRTVCFELPDCNEQSQENKLWQTRVPLLAFQSEIVLDTVLAITALHMQSLKPDDRNLAVATAHYLNRAVAKHRLALPQINTSNAETLLVAAILISTTTWLHLHRSHPHEQYEPPIHAYRMIKGVSSLYLWQRSLFDHAGYGWFGDEEPIEVDPDILESSDFLRTVREDLAQLTKGLGAHYSKDPKTFDAAVGYVLQLYAAYATNGPSSHIHRFIGTMPARLPPEFLQLLADHDPLAMALLARALVLLKALDYAWWIQGPHDNDVLTYDLCGMCSLMPRDCLWGMEWPLNIFSAQLPSAVSFCSQEVV